MITRPDLAARRLRIPDTTGWGIALAFLVALISGISVFVNSYGVKQVPDAAVYTTLKNGVAALILIGFAALVVRGAELRALDPNQPLADVRTLEEYLDRSVAQRRLTMLLLAAFAGIAFALAAVGIYGVLAHSVAQRTREIGLRMALGARAHDVLRMVVSQGMGVVGAGVLAGVAGALMLTRVMTSLLFGVSATDPLTFAGVAAVFAGVALLACWLPARRAARVDPMVALRYE